MMSMVIYKIIHWWNLWMEGDFIDDYCYQYCKYNNYISKHYNYNYRYYWQIIIGRNKKAADDEQSLAANNNVGVSH